MKFDLIIIGGGHAGVEACFSSCKQNLNVCLITLNKLMIANMPCNPSIGGSAKGIVVREIDALGGIMAKASDNTYLQMKMLNTGKGPGVQCLRAQNDKHDYPDYVQSELNKLTNLTIIEDEVIDITHSNNVVNGVKLLSGKSIETKAVVITTGTYLDSKVLQGKEVTSSGPDGENSSTMLAESLKKLGLELIRLKTGTPPRIKKSSIDFSRTKLEPGTNAELAFSYSTTKFLPFEQQIPCHLVYTNLKTHDLILNNLDQTAQFSGLIDGVGPRYCPSIESKVTTFKDRERHQLFLEPEYRNGESIYIQGFSTSISKELQLKLVRSIEGLENAEIIKYAYAIEYEAIQPTEFDLTLAIKKYKGLFGAGQLCGTSGYEEAAGLGLVAGLNAAMYVMNKSPLILKRNESYIGVMIDDIVTKGVDEPYRLLSSRAEYRLLLRHDNADLRLSKIAYQYDLINDDIFNSFESKLHTLNELKSLLKSINLSPNNEINAYLKSLEYNALTTGISAYDLLKRPKVMYLDLLKYIPQLNEYKLDKTGIMQLEIMIKFEGYISKQEKDASTFSKYDDYKLASEINYLEINGLALEARQKLEKIKPLTISQAGRISGINPSDLSVLIMFLKKSGNYEF